MERKSVGVVTASPYWCGQDFTSRLLYRYCDIQRQELILLSSDAIGGRRADRYCLVRLTFVLLATVGTKPGASVLLLQSEPSAGHPSQSGGDILCAGQFQNAVVIRFKARSKHHPKGRLLLKFEWQQAVIIYIIYCFFIYAI
jgi:hypothetical protein